MQDFEYTLLMLLALLAASSIYLLAIVRHQKKTIASLTSGSPTASDAQLAQKEREVEELRQRVQVLERITVDKENSLARQIEELRTP